MSTTPRTAAVSKPASTPLAVPRLPIELYRGIAAVMIVLMIVIAALAPLGDSSAAATQLQTSTFNTQSGELSSRLFDYVTESQRQQVIPPQRQTLLRESTLSPYARLDIVGEMMIESSGPDANSGAYPAPKALRDSALGGGTARWDSMESFYNAVEDAWTTNGLGAVAAMRSTAASGADRTRLEFEAIQGFSAAALGAPGQWDYFYNWGLGEMLRGNNQQAVLMFQHALGVDATHPEVSFHLGIAQLRLGEPGEALKTWYALLGQPANDWTAVTNEAIGDALAANGDGSGALKKYIDLQTTGSAMDWSLLDKIERLQILRGADSLLDTLTSFSNRFPDEQRLHYDRGRLLMALGRYGPAESELRRAAELRPDEAAFPLAQAELALAAGKPADALKFAETASTKAGLDLNSPDLDLVYTRLTNPNRYQQSFAQQVLDMQLTRATAWNALGQRDNAKNLAQAVLNQGGSDQTKAPWFRYYAGLIYAAGGLVDEAKGIFRDALKAPAATGPSAGAFALAWSHALGNTLVDADYAEILKALGGQPGQPAPAADVSAAYAYYDLAQLLESVGRKGEAAPLYRAAAAWEAGQRGVTGQPPLSPTGLYTPVELAAAEADFLLRNGQFESAAARYQGLLNVEPSAAGAHTNRGLSYYRQGNDLLARREFELATRLDPGNTLAQHNLGVLALREGPGDLLTALNALGGARVSGGAAALRLGDDIVGDDQAVGLPTPTDAPDFLSRVPALLALLLLLLHTLIFSRSDDAANSRTSVLGNFGEALANRLPALNTRTALIVAIVISGIAWGMASVGFGAGVWALIGFALLGIVAAAIAIGGQEAAQMFALRQEKHPGTLTERVWPLGLLLSIVGAPFGLVYGWTVATKASGGSAPAPEPLAPVVEAPAAPKKPANKRVAQPVATATAPAAGATAERLPLRGWGAMGPAARVAAAGLIANLVLALVFGLLYGFFGNPLWRLILLANVAVLAFTAVSEPQAEGGQLWRRSPLLWLLLFMAAATALTALLLRVV